MIEFHGSVAEAVIHRVAIRTVASAYGNFTFTDVTFAYMGNYYGCRFHGALTNLQHERRRFTDRQRNRKP